VLKTAYSGWLFCCFGLAARDCIAHATMPLAPVALVLAPKAGAAVATAMAMGPDDLVHHADALMHQVHDHATAFIQLPMAKSKIFDMVVGPEIKAYHWAHDKVAGLWDSVAGHGASAEATPEQGRMVEYFAASCPHCKTLEQPWKDAEGLWHKQEGEHAQNLVWQQKQCLDDNWKPGTDFQECQAAGINRFPAIKFYAPGSKTGEDFFMDRTPAQMVDFAKTGMEPDPHVLARAPGDMSDMKLVDFYAEACPHCKHLEPIWEDAHKQWDKAIGQTDAEHPRDDLPLITFEKKECYDSHWKAGADNAECQKFHVDAFPNIKLFVPDPHGHGFTSVDFEGDRTPEGIVAFLKEQTGMAEAQQQLDANAAALPTAHIPAAPAVETPVHAAGPIGVHVPDEINQMNKMLDGLHVPEGLKAAAAAAAAEHHGEQAGGAADMLVLQGNTAHVSDSHPVPAAPEHQPAAAVPLAGGGEKLEAAFKDAVRTAVMPLQVLSCMPVRKPWSAPVSPQRAPLQKPPAATAQFI